MAAISQDQHNVTRSVTETILYSLSLKIDNNLYEYVVLLVGINDDHYLCQNLPKMISEYRVKPFDDINESLTFVNSLSDTHIFLIISGALGEHYAHQFVNQPQIIGIYVYCLNESRHRLWTKDINKIRCTTSDTTQLLARLHADIKQLSDRWPFEQQSFRKALTNTSQWYHLFLRVICNRVQYDEQSQKEMFDECRAYYKNNGSMIKKINEFEKTYKSADAIREYTRDSFVYRIVNHALRTQNMKTIRKFAPFIRDLHSALYVQHQDYYYSREPSIRVVYRGQYLNLKDIDYLSSLCESRSPVITMTTFSSTSLDPDVAMSLLYPTDNQIACLFEIIITDEYNTEHKHMPEHEQAFADIASYSVMRSEQEVLFSLVTHFRIKAVEYPVNSSNGSLALITLELMTDKRGKSTRSHFDIVNRMKKENDPKIYNEVLHMLEINAEDEMKFNSTNWQKWWSRLESQWGTDRARDQPLNLIFYNCFTDNKDWSRKAIEMHKDILHSIPDIQSNQSSFSYLFAEYKPVQQTPTRWLALFEEYLKPFCTADSKEVVQCLCFAGDTYRMISDHESALECYQEASKMNVNDKYQMNNQIQKQIKMLTRSLTTNKTMKNERTRLERETKTDLPEKYEVEQEEWLIYWIIKNNIDDLAIYIMRRLDGLSDYLFKREQWYDESDAKIILRLPYDTSLNLSIESYYLNFLLSVNEHMSSYIRDAANNSFLSRWRYEKYMHEWNFLKTLEQFLQPFYDKTKSSRLADILTKLNRLLKNLVFLLPYVQFIYALKKEVIESK